MGIKERISELEDGSEESTQTDELRDQKMRYSEKNQKQYIR